MNVHALVYIAESGKTSSAMAVYYNSVGLKAVTASCDIEITSFSNFKANCYL